MPRLLLLLLAFTLVAAFAILNWGTITTPTQLHFGLFDFTMPLGLLMLGFTLLVILAFAVQMAIWQGTILLETRRHTKELQQQRTLADQAEASRFTELNNQMKVQFSQLLAQLQDWQDANRKELRDNFNSLAAMIGQMDDQIAKTQQDPPRLL